MQDEYTITPEEAREISALLTEYLNQGGIGFDETAILNTIDALEWADRIIIQERV